MSPRVPMFSLLVAAKHCPRRIHTLAHALAGQRFRDWEMVIAVDDVADAEPIYSAAISHEPRARLAVRDRRATGPGGARNDAFRASAGRYIVLLDADDSLPDDYLLQFATFFQRQPKEQAAMTPTRVELDTGNGTRRPLFTQALDVRGGVVTMREYERLIVSTHVVCRRAEHIAWPESGFAEDVVRDALLVLRHGRVPVLPTEYRALIHAGQYTQSGRWTEEAIRESYVRTAVLYPELATLFLRRAAANAYFSANRRREEDWYAFWAERQGEMPEVETL